MHTIKSLKNIDKIFKRREELIRSFATEHNLYNTTLLEVEDSIAGKTRKVQNTDLIRLFWEARMVKEGVKGFELDRSEVLKINRAIREYNLFDWALKVLGRKVKPL